MRWARRLLVISFVESFAMICVERGIYFYTEDVLGFSKARNLWIALAFGAAYLTGAYGSHWAARRFGEKRMLLLTVAGQLAVHLALGVHAGAVAVYVGTAAIGLLNGLKWPVVESYISAGHNPAATMKSVGRFNVTWASAVPLSVALSGVLIRVWTPGLFYLAAALNVAALAMIATLGDAPEHMADDHPDRPPAEGLAVMKRLTAASCWLLLASYSLMWIMAALVPQIFKGLGYNVEYGAILSTPVEVIRVVMFLAMGLTVGWHGRRWPIIGGLVLLPLGFGMVISAHSTLVVIGGQLVFGLAAGAVYFAHLYYATVVENASVGAGARHEGLIGLGFATGPAAGLIGIALASAVGAESVGVLLGAAPLMLFCAVASVRALIARPGT